MGQTSVAVANSIMRQDTWGSSSWRVIEGGHGKAHTPSKRQQTLALCATLALAISLVFVWLVSDGVQARRRQDALSQADVAIVTVLPGDSLWQIAQEHPVPGLTTDELVHVIREDNRLASTELQAGMQLEVPVCL